MCHSFPLNVRQKVLKAVGSDILLHSVLVVKPFEKVRARQPRIQDHFYDLLHWFVLNDRGSLIDKPRNLSSLVGTSDQLDDMVSN